MAGVQWRAVGAHAPAARVSLPTPPTTSTAMISNLERYSYIIDPRGDATANKVLRLVGRDRRVLELGCSAGTMTRPLAENGCRVVALEIDPVSAEHARPHCERLLIADLDRADLGALTYGETFDVVLIADVLEHLKDPWHCLAMARERLNAEGYLVISVPNIGHMALLGELLSGRFCYRDKGLLDRTHLRFFTRTDLEDMLLASGFLPAVWERYEVAPEATEFANSWQRLPLALQQHLQTLEDHQTYQFIVKAYPSTEAGWVAKTRAEAQGLGDRRQALEEENQQLKTALAEGQREREERQRALVDTQASLALRDQQLEEHRQTLAEAKAHLNQRQTLLDEHIQAFAEAKAAIACLEDQRQTLEEEKQQLATRLWDAERTLKARIVNRVRRWLP